MHGIDIETAAPDGTGSLDVQSGNIRLVQLSDGESTEIYDLYHEDAEAVRAAIAKRNDLVAHNATFERTWIAEKLGLDLPNLHDTLVMSKVFYTGTNAAKRKMGHELENAVYRVLKVEMDKSEQESRWGEPVLTRSQIEYAARDALYMPALADRLMSKIERASLRDVYDLERRITFAVDRMQRNGFAVNEEKLNPLVEEATAEVTRLKEELTQEWGINPGSTKQLVNHFGLAKRPEWLTTPAKRRAPGLEPRAWTASVRGNLL